MKKIWLVGLIIGIPLIGLAVSEGIQAHFNSQLRSALRDRYPQADESAISSITIEQLCIDPSPEIRDICQTHRNLNLMSAAAIGSAAVGLLLLLAIRLAGSASRNNRALLLMIFKPGLYITAIILIGLIVINAGVVIGAIYYGESILINRVHIGIIALIGLGALGGIAVIAQSLLSLVIKAKTFVVGTNLTREEAPELWNKIDSTADKLNALRPQQIVVGLDPNFFVTEADVVCLNANLSGRTMYCSLPLSRILTKNEFSSVIGHELGHFKGLDTKFSIGFYPIYRGTVSSITSLYETGGESSASIALLPAIAILSYFLECFSVAESRISRDRELAADQEGASITGAATFGAALVKIHAFSGLWNVLQEVSVEALKEGKAFTNVSKVYGDAVKEQANLNMLKDIAETRVSHPTDSHPPLGARLESLGITVRGVSGASLAVSPPEPAINYIDSFEKIEEEISGAYQMILAKQYGIDLDTQTENSDTEPSTKADGSP
jgi:Zn-dependent protease with chaperone function